VLAQQPLPGAQLDLPFPTMQFDTLGTCKLHAVVTNQGNRVLATSRSLGAAAASCG